MQFYRKKSVVALARISWLAALVAAAPALAQETPKAAENAPANAPAVVAEAQTPADNAAPAVVAQAVAPADQNAPAVVAQGAPQVQTQQAPTTTVISADQLPPPQQRIKVDVIGSSIKRTLEDQSLPVQIMTKDDISRSGVQNMEQLMAKISATASTGGVFGGQLAGVETYGQSAVSLRGLGANRTLVLLDGQRVTPFAQELATGVDINAIPVSAIERVEVLTDGASSIYGSDAVAGVINFVLRRNFTGVTVGYEYDTPTSSGEGGTTSNWWGSVGYGDINKDKFNVTGSYQQKKETSLIAADRNFAQSGNVPPFFVNAATPSGRIEGVWVPGTPTASNARSAANPFGFSTGGYGNPATDLPGGCPALGGHFAVKGAPSAGTGTNCNFDSAPFVELFPRVTTKSGVVTADVQFTPQARGYFTGLYTKNEIQNIIQPNPARIAFFQTDNAFAGSGVDAALLIFPGNPNYPHTYLQSHGLAAMDGQVLAVTSRAFATGGREEDDTNTQQEYVLGLKGTWYKDWDYDISGMWSKSKSEGTVQGGYFGQVCYANAWNTLGNTAGTFVDPWSVGGAQNDTLTAAFRACNYRGPTATAEEKLYGFQGKTSGNIYDMANGPLTMAVGASWQKYTYNVDVPAILSQGDISGLGGAVATQNGDRTVTAAYVEFAIPVTKDINVNASARVDHYNDIQSDATPVTGKVSATWQATPSVMFRGSVGNGFRAPAMGDLHKPVVLGTSEQFVDPEFADQGPIQVNAFTGGNPLLKPEKSNQASAGIVWTPVPNFTGRVDYWWIQIKNYITAPSALAMVNAARAGGFIFTPNEVTFAPDGEVDTVNEVLQNAGKAIFSGLDFAANWRQPTAWGTVGIDYNGTYYFQASLNTISAWEHNVATIVDPGTLIPLQIPTTGGVIPRYKQVVNFNWNYGPWGATLTNNYITGYETAPNQADGFPHFVGSFTTWDIQGTYSGFKYLNFVVGWRNLFNQGPNLFIPTANQFQYGYDPTVYDPRGRVFYARAIFSWP